MPGVDKELIVPRIVYCMHVFQRGLMVLLLGISSIGIVKLGLHRIVHRCVNAILILGFLQLCFSVSKFTETSMLAETFLEMPTESPFVLKIFNSMSKLAILSS